MNEVLTEDEKKVITSMELFVDYIVERKSKSKKIIYLKPEQYKFYLGMVEKKENNIHGYEYLEFNLGCRYRGFGVKKEVYDEMSNQ